MILSFSYTKLIHNFILLENIGNYKSKIKKISKYMN